MARYTNNARQGIASESDGSRAAYYISGPDGGLVSQITSEGNFYYVFDGQGSVVALTDEQGEVAASYKYDPYGNLTEETGEVQNPWLYTGAYLDRETGLYKMDQRYYDPSTGRWTQQDPVYDPADPAQSNLYAYVGNNPVNYSDHEGEKRKRSKKAERRARKRAARRGRAVASVASFKGTWRGVKKSVRRVWRATRYARRYNPYRLHKTAQCGWYRTIDSCTIDLVPFLGDPDSAY